MDTRNFLVVQVWLELDPLEVQDQEVSPTQILELAQQTSDLFKELDINLVAKCAKVWNASETEFQPQKFGQKKRSPAGDLVQMKLVAIWWSFSGGIQRCLAFNFEP